MHERPADLSDADLTALLRRRWDLDIADVRYEPVGFGGYHWSALDPAGRPWFVTANRVASRDGLADLRATMRAALGLARAGLDFVVAPVQAADGEVVVSIRPQLAVSVFPFAGGVPGQWGDPGTDYDRLIITEMLAELHAAGPAAHRRPAAGSAAAGLPAAGAAPDLPVRDLPVRDLPVRDLPVRDLPVRGLPVRGLNPDSRTHLDAALRDRGRSWRGGPYAEPARALVADYADGLLAALAAFDDLAARLLASGDQLVVTHGEVHPGNLIRNGAGYLLIDWDTAGLAPPERDLWWIVSDSGAEAPRYAELTGREVSQSALALYRLRWDLDDIGLFLADFRAPHRRDQDTEHALAGLTTAIQRVSSPEKFS